MRHLSAELLSGRPGPRRNPLGSIDSEGCRTQATRHLSAVLLSGQPSPWRCPLGSVTDLSKYRSVSKSPLTDSDK